MSSAKPSWGKLLEMGRLPQSQRKQISSLVTIDSLEKRLKDLEAGACDSCKEKLFGAEPRHAELKCPVEGCAFIGRGKSPANSLRLHSKTHEPKA